MTHTNRILILLKVGILLIACGWAAGAYTQELLDRVVAVVENETITQRELMRNLNTARQMLAQQNRPIPDEQTLLGQVLQQTITRKLQLQEAARLGIRIDEITLDRSLNSMAQKNNLTLAELKARVEQSGQSFEALRENTRDDLTIQRVVQREVIDPMEVSEQEIKDFLIAKSAALNENLIYRFARLKVPLTADEGVTQRVKEALLRIHTTLSKESITNVDLFKKRVGELWREAYAQAKKEDQELPRYRITDLGWQGADQLPAPVNKRLQTLSAGQQLPPIMNSQGSYVFHLIAIQSGDQTMVKQKYHVRHILMQTTPMEDDNAVENKLAKIKRHLDKGGDFAKAARKYSQDPGSGYKGGDLGWNSLEAYAPAFASAALEAHKQGTIYGPFKSNFGWHLVEVLGAREENISDQAHRDQAISQIKQRKLNDEIRIWLLKLREERHIQVLL